MDKIKEFEVIVFKNFEVVDFGDDFLRREIVVILLEEVISIFIFIILNLVFVVMYLGSVILDRRYFLQFVMFWVMVEVKRRKFFFYEVILEVKEYVFSVQKFNSEGVLFEYKFICMIRFVKIY